MTIVHKETTAAVDPKTLEYVMSDATIDRYGDSIDPRGWRMKEFMRNPIALFNHKADAPIGKWVDIRVENGALKGRLEFAAAGTSPRIDELRSLAEQGILRAVSVGFRPVAGEMEPMANGKGVKYKAADLVECSIVSIPANPNALQIAKALHVSDEVKAEVFGESAEQDQGIIRRTHGETARQNSPLRTPPMNAPLSQRIEDAQNRLVALRDELTNQVEKMGESPDSADLEVMDGLNQRIEMQERTVASLRDAETRLAQAALPTTTVVGSTVTRTTDTRRPFAVPVEKVKPTDLILRTLVARLHSHASRGEVSPQQALALRYGEDGKVSDEQRTVFDVVTRAATAPATTTTSGWASQLVETAFNGFLELLMPAAVFPGLSARGMRLNFGRAGVISIPTRAATPTIAGSFVAEGAPIPVRQGAFTSQTFTPKKLAVITTFTREIAEHSNPSIEGLLRNAIQEDTSVAVDTVLLDATAASAVRPAGIRNGVTVTTATAGGGFAALVGDLKTLVGALIVASSGNIRQPVWIMNPIQALAIAVTQNAGGDFPFAAEINGGRFQGYPVIQSSTVTSGMVFLVDADDFVSIEGGAPRFDVSDQATLHLDDTTPLAIGTAGAPATVAAPVRSLYQTDSMALRMILDLNWGMRRTGVVAWTQSVTW